MKNLNQRTEDKNSGPDELKHRMNNHLSIVGYFLSYSNNIESDELFKELLKNAEKSFEEVLKIYREF
jgi:hypothetical protein